MKKSELRELKAIAIQRQKAAEVEKDYAQARKWSLKASDIESHIQTAQDG